MMLFGIWNVLSLDPTCLLITQVRECEFNSHSRYSTAQHKAVQRMTAPYWVCKHRICFVTWQRMLLVSLCLILVTTKEHWMCLKRLLLSWNCFYSCGKVCKGTHCRAPHCASLSEDPNFFIQISHCKMSACGDNYAFCNFISQKL